MKIVLTAGGTGGHFYPLIAVAESIRETSKERKLLPPKLYYLAPDQYDKRLLFENDIEFRRIPAGKIRRYFSLANALDVFKTAWGVLRALWTLFFIFPDVVFSKGGYASVPTVFAARILRIPVVIHESDASVGRANRWAGKFAASIGISYPEAAEGFGKQKERVALVGNPIRKAVSIPAKEGAHEFLHLEEGTPILLVLGGSQGAQRINDTILEMLPRLVEKYQVIHQTGRNHYKEISETAGVILQSNPNQRRYRAFDYLNDLAIRMAAGASNLVISRAGSGSIFEIASWGLPAILIPIDKRISHDQHKNAFSFARAGAAVVVDEQNLEPNVLLSEIERLMADAEGRAKMGEAARAFARPEAAKTIAEELIAYGLKHER